MENNDQDNYTDEQFNTPINYTSIPPERHGCVTTWLVIMLIFNTLVSLFYFFKAEFIERTIKTPISIIYILGIIGVLNVGFSILMLKWKKVGFYGFAALGVVTFAINISIGVSVVSSVLGLVGFAVLYAVFQIKKNGVSAWQYLK